MDHTYRGAALDFDAGGIDPMSATLAAFADRLRLENHTLKRSLTDPHLFSGIGNAYSDEILFDAKLSPLRLTSKLTDEEVARLRTSTQKILRSWSEKLAEETPGFPVKVTAFREDFTVHGRYGKPCRVCSRPVMRIAYAENEANYCAQCQNEGRLLADRALSRLMKSDFPRTLEDLEAKKAQARAVFSGSEPAPVTEPKSAKPRRAKKKPTP